MTEVETAAERLRRYVVDTRKARGLTQDQAAKRAGIPLSTWGTIESRPNTMPKPENLLAIAKGLSVPLLALLRVIEGKPPGLAPDEQYLSALMGEMSDTGRKLVVEWLTSPEEKRRAVEAGLIALLAALGRPPEAD